MSFLIKIQTVLDLYPKHHYQEEVDASVILNALDITVRFNLQN